MIRDRTFEKDGIQETRVEYNLHTGTHMDMPLHVIEGGKDTDDIDLEAIFGMKAKVVDMTGAGEKITPEELKYIKIEKGDFLLFKTSSSFTGNYLPGFTYLSKEAALYLADMGIAGAGMDSLGIEREQEGRPSHNILPGRGIIIIEGLRPGHVREVDYMMYALPVKIMKAEAASLRVLLSEHFE